MDKPVEVSGYAEARATSTDAYGAPLALVERLRPTLDYRPFDRVRLSTTLESHLEQGRYTPTVLRELLTDQLGEDVAELALASSGCDLPLYRSYDSLGEILTVDRLYLDLELPKLDLRLGRQAVNWGSALTFNPTDVFAEVIVAEPWRERRGVDAARVTVPIGEDVQIVAVAGADDVLADDIAWKTGLRGTWRAPGADLSGVAYLDEESWFAGVDLKGDLVVGWWLEGGYTRTLDSEDGHAELSVGLDYSFPVFNVLYLAAQLSYNGGASADADPAASFSLADCSDALSSSAGATGRLYGVGALSWRLTDSFSLAGSTLWNLDDGTGLIFPYAGLAVGERLSLNAGAQFLLGEDGEFRPDPAGLVVGPVDFSPLVPTVNALAWARVSL